MPVGPLVIPGIMAGANLLGQLGSGFMQGQTNKKEREWQEKMYARQRADSLADWNMQNEYNSPSAQMARLRDANLNPNLVYGNGSVVGESSMPRSANPGSYNPVSPRIDLGSVAQSGLAAYYDMQIKEAQTDNLKAQNNVLLQDSALKAAQVNATLATTENTKASTQRSQYDLDYSKSIRDMSIEALALSNSGKRLDQAIALSDSDLRVASTASNLQEAAERILRSRAERSKVPLEKTLLQKQIDNLEKDGTLKQLDINLKKNGIQPGDPAYIRVLTQLVSGVGLTGLIDRINGTSPIRRKALDSSAYNTPLRFIPKF